MTKYEQLAATCEAGTLGADPAFWETKDKALEILAPLDDVYDFVRAVEDQPLSYVAFLLSDGADALDALATRHTLLSVEAREVARTRAVTYREAAESIRAL